MPTYRKPRKAARLKPNVTREYAAALADIQDALTLISSRFRVIYSHCESMYLAHRSKLSPEDYYTFRPQNIWTQMSGTPPAVLVDWLSVEIRRLEEQVVKVTGSDQVLFRAQLWKEKAERREDKELMDRVRPKLDAKYGRKK